MLITYTLLLTCILPSKSLESLNSYFLPGTTYSQLGDINIGALLSVANRAFNNPAGACSKEVSLTSYTVDATEGVKFAVDSINHSPDILPNVTLGFVIRGICSGIGITLGTSFSFLTPSQMICNGSICTTQVGESDTTWPSDSVIGVMGAGMSTLAVPVSSLYAVGQLPLVGATETSDELSNKRNHPYFFRIVPPDRYQVQGMLRFITSNGWSYISVIYEDGSYGQKAFDRIQQSANTYGICIATSHRLISPRNYDNIVSDLLLNHRARAVILFIYQSSFKKILRNLVDRNATDYFVWIGSDAVASYKSYNNKGANTDPGTGTFVFDLYTTPATDFITYLKKQKVSTTKNPWMKPVWEHLFDCSFQEKTCDPTVDIFQSTKYHTQSNTPLRIDVIRTLAQAAHDLLSIKCPDARGQEARACITGELLREFLKITSFDGNNGRVTFDENQDVKGKYRISQLTNTGEEFLSKKPIGYYDVATDTFTYFREEVSWSHLTFVNMSEDSMFTDVPQSKCSVPCRVGEYKVEKELPCCWDCRKCRENEHLVKDNTTCETCPPFMWPDPASGFTTCIDIPLTYPMFNDPIPIIFTFVAICALVFTVSMIVGYAIYRNERVIKASSRELSAIQLVAIFAGFATVILFQTKPSDITCGIIFFLFCMSFVLLYSPLLVKTVRICRIFKGGAKNKRPRFISTPSQLIFASFLSAVQAILCVTVYILYWPSAKRTQPIWSEKLVELSCDLTFPGIAAFLGYNIVLIFLCSIFAFMVRKLPDNFNESKFISMCVFTTLIIWLAFVPAYFAAHREFVRAFLLSVALFLNHSVALMFLFVPKIYAAKFLPPEASEFSKTRSVAHNKTTS